MIFNKNKYYYLLRLIFLAGGTYPLSSNERLTTVTELTANLLEKG